MKSKVCSARGLFYEIDGTNGTNGINGEDREVRARVLG